jgi:Rps23 Pro-64 3,4-dihydroxylase Tpa1-like proline 4-hydroxylase
MNRSDIAELIRQKLEMNFDNLVQMYQESKSEIGYFFIDDLLPNELVSSIFTSFPAGNSMKLKKSLREYKYIAAQMNNYNPLLEEVVYAFQDLKVVDLVTRICGENAFYPDTHLYAGGISMMGDKHFLNPHLDNSHDKDRKQWRVLNLLYYVTPEWDVTNGGNLELWPNGLENMPQTIHSKFNRLVVMATHDRSWHSVSPVSSSGKARCCISNYYFSNTPLNSEDVFHVTSFRGRPNQKIRDLILRADIKIRTGIRKVFKKGIGDNSHLYKK